MATLKAAAVRNQDLLEKITQENEALVSVCRALKNELAEAQEALARCKSETLKSMEPKIQKILDDHKQSLHSQASSLQQELDSITAAADAKLAKLTSEHEAAKESLEKECKATLQRMKDTALASERKMKDDLSARLSKVPREIEESRRAARERLQSDRSQWQEQRGRELREEFEQRHQVELQRLRDKQARIVHELEEKLRVEASNENADLKNRLMKDESIHRDAETAIKQAVDEVESEIQRIRRHRSELVQEQQRLREKMSGCRCDKLRLQLQEQQMKREEVARNVETQKQKLHEMENAREGGATGLAAEITKMEEALRMMRAEVDQARAESVARRELREARVRELEVKHQKEMEVVGVKVRQTVEKKDQIIQQLMDRLQAFGNADVF